VSFLKEKRFLGREINFNMVQLGKYKELIEKDVKYEQIVKKE
jgi:hypothetical protein